MAGPIRIAIITDSKKASKEIATFGDKVGRASRKSALALGAIGAAGAVAAKKAEEVASSNARVGQVLDNMGQGKATQRTLEYAEALEKTLGVDENVIKSTQAMLGTFEDVAKTAGDAGGVFDRATLAAQDLAAAGFGSAEGNATQLGKALQDPIKGLTALTKSGVTFTDQQKEQIKAMVAAGDTAGAQEKILAAVEKQVGGTAEATADSSAKIGIAFGNVAESMGALLLPALDGLAVAAEKVAGFAERNTKVFAAMVGVVAAVAVGIIALNVAMKIVTATKVAWAVATKAVAVAQIALNVAMSLNPIGLVIVAIVALVAVFVVAYKRSEKFRAIIQAAFAGVKAAASAVASFFTTQVPKAFAKVTAAAASVLGWVKSNWKTIITILAGPIGAAVLAITKNWDKITQATAAMVAAVKQKFGEVVDFVKGIPGKIKAAFSGAGTLLVGIGGDIVQGLINGIRNAAGRVTAAAQALVDKIPGPIRKAMGIASPSKVMKLIGEQIGTGLVVGLKASTKDVGNALKELRNKLRNNVREMTQTMRDMRDSLADSLRGELDLGSLIPQQDAGSVWASNAAASAGLTFDAIRQRVAGLAARARTFAAKLSAMARAGIPRGLINEVAALGSSNGITVADALLSGSRAQVRALASDFAAVNRNTLAAGQALADINYREDFRELQSELKTLNKAVKEWNKLSDRSRDKAADKIVKGVNSAAAKGKRNQR